MGNTTISDRVTISHSDNTWTFNAGEQIDEKNKAGTKNIEIFKILRAADGDETTLSEKDLKELAKNTALLRSMGYSIEIKDDKEYVLTYDNNKSVTFNFETIKETAVRKWNEFWENRENEKRQNEIKRAEENLPSLQKKYDGKYVINFDKNKEQYIVYIQRENINIHELASNLGLNELEVAKAVEKAYSCSATTEPESCLYDERHVHRCKELSATISNHEKGLAPDSYNSEFEAYDIPEDFNLIINL